MTSSRSFRISNPQFLYLCSGDNNTHFALLSGCLPCSSLVCPPGTLEGRVAPESWPSARWPRDYKTAVPMIALLRHTSLEERSTMLKHFVKCIFVYKYWPCYHVWNIPATSSFPLWGLGRHKVIMRPEGLRGKNLVPLDDDGVGGVFIKHSYSWCHWAPYVHYPLTPHNYPKISLVQKEGNWICERLSNFLKAT